MNRKEWSVSDHYKKLLPEGTPLSDKGLPLYPDPNIYPPEVIANYSTWVEIFRDGDLLNVRQVSPSKPKYKRTATIRRGESREEVIRLLGVPSLEQWNFEENFHDRYSREVAIVYQNETKLVDFIFTVTKDSSTNVNWDLAFIDPSALAPGEV